jgi:hypothetical protein
MKAHYLKAVDEAALYEALEAAGLYQKVYSEFDEDGNPVGEFEWQKVGEYDLDIIGAIFKPTGVMLSGEDGEYPEMEKIEGYHANIRGITEEQAEMLPTIEAPDTPVRIWAGD